LYILFVRARDEFLFVFAIIWFLNLKSIVHYSMSVNEGLLRMGDADMRTATQSTAIMIAALY